MPLSFINSVSFWSESGFALSSCSTNCCNKCLASLAELSLEFSPIFFAEKKILIQIHQTQFPNIFHLQHDSPWTRGFLIPQKYLLRLKVLADDPYLEKKVLLMRNDRLSYTINGITTLLDRFF